MEIPHFVRRRAVPDALVARVLAHAAGQQRHATPSELHVGGDETVDTEARIAFDVPLDPGIEEAFRSLALEWLPDACTAIGVSPFTPTNLEVSIAAHGDGAFYGRHIDTVTGARPGGASPRRVSFVCYAFREPKRFTGGALRLFDLFARQHIDIEPESGLVVAFPSWCLHEVRRVSCPDCAFEDYRFGVNVWVEGRTADPTGR